MNKFGWDVEKPTRFSHAITIIQVSNPGVGNAKVHQLLVDGQHYQFAVSVCCHGGGTRRAGSRKQLINFHSAQQNAPQRDIARARDQSPTSSNSDGIFSKVLNEINEASQLVIVGACATESNIFFFFFFFFSGRGRTIYRLDH